MLQHLIGPTSFPSTTNTDTISVLTWNILLPNSQDGWWTYKMYYPPLITKEEQVYSSWEYRQNLIKERIKIVNADVVCFQEVSPLSFESDFLFMRNELGYTGYELFKKGRFRPATFWKEDRVELLSSPVHKDRTLLTAFRRKQLQLPNPNPAFIPTSLPNTINVNSNESIEKDSTKYIDIINPSGNNTQQKQKSKKKNNNNVQGQQQLEQQQHQYQHWYVMNCHLQAGKQGSRRLRQINEGMKGIITLGKKLQGKKYPVESNSTIIVCGDFNGDTIECGAVRFLEDGYVTENFIEDNEIITSTRKVCPLSKPMIDVPSAVNSSRNNIPPPTLVVPELISLLIQQQQDDDNNVDDNGNGVTSTSTSIASTAYDNPKLSTIVIQRLQKIYNSLATGSNNTIMILCDVQKYLTLINGQVGRGDEYRTVAKHMIASLISSVDEKIQQQQQEEQVENSDNIQNTDNNVQNNTDNNSNNKIAVDDTTGDKNGNNNEEGDGDDNNNKKDRIDLPTDECAILTVESFIDIYQQELNHGKFWSIAHDLALLGQPLDTKQLLFKGRYDRMYCSANVQIVSVQDFMSNNCQCPNQYEPSDHLPIAALFTV